MHEDAWKHASPSCIVACDYHVCIWSFYACEVVVAHEACLFPNYDPTCCSGIILIITNHSSHTVLIMQSTLINTNLIIHLKLHYIHFFHQSISLLSNQSLTWFSYWDFGSACRSMSVFGWSRGLLVHVCICLFVRVCVCVCVCVCVIPK